MKNDPMSNEDFLEKLLGQEPALNKSSLVAARGQLLERLHRATQRERLARWLSLTVAAVAVIGFSVLYAADMQKLNDAVGWPLWSRCIATMFMLLFPFFALLLLGIYVFRHRRELSRAREAVRQAAFSEALRQIDELRKSPGVSKPPADTAPRAFTLIELLLTLAILTLLASLLLTSLSSAKPKALTASCRNQLCQIGKALAMYTWDFDRYPGSRGCPLHPDNPGLAHRGNTHMPWVLWNEKILPYVQNSARIFRCPAHEPFVMPGAWTNFSYGYNSMGGGLKNPLENLGLGRVTPPDDLDVGSPMLYVRTAEISAPSDMIAIIDLADHGAAYLSAVAVPGSDYFGPAPRHSGGANAVFSDIHVEWQKASKWNEASGEVRQRWNKDHLPHPESW